MKTPISRIVLAGAFALVALRSGSAQEVNVTNLVTNSKERVLRVESTVPASPKAVWEAFATEEGLKKWVAPVVALDLRVGGTLSTHYDKKASIGSPGTIRLGIVNYLEGELITYKVHLTSSFSPKARAEDQNLQEIIQIVPWTNGTTKVISSMVGWGTGKDWDEAYNFFAKGNAWSYKQLVKCFSADRR
ncbi:MAG TPA: SRPBCC domain-containing protein [Dongiaceae bacterium]|nr:SRPBCC domain-containing protein [Dongiaceae bacterium]